MAYSTQSDILNQVSLDELIELTDDEGLGEIDTTVLARAIADADAEIDSYCGTRYGVPFETTPPMIRKLSVDLVISALYQRRPSLKIADETQKRYDNAIRFLQEVAKGLVNLGAASPAEGVDSGPGATTSKEDRIFTRGRRSDSSSGSLDNY